MNKTILITGATSGFGKAIAQRFAKEGYGTICITGRREDRLNELKTELEQHGAKVITLAFDVRNRRQVEQALANLKDHVQQIDVLVNNAGLASGLATIDEGNIDDWET